MELLAYSHQVQVVDIKKKNMHDKAENQGRFSTRFKAVVAQVFLRHVSLNIRVISRRSSTRRCEREQSVLHLKVLMENSGQF